MFQRMGNTARITLALTGLGLGYQEVVHKVLM